MEHKTYYLPHNKSCAGPGNVIFYDTEAYFDPSIQYSTCELQRLRLGVAIAGRFEGGKWTREKRCRFKNSTEWWSFVASRSLEKTPTWIFAHNIGYDLIISQFPELLESGEFLIFDPTKPEQKTDFLGQNFVKSTGFICLDNPPVIISATHKDGWRVIFVDTFNFWTTPLSKIGEMVGHAKLTMPERTAPDEEWFDYCEGDVEVLKVAVTGYINWLKDENLGKFRFTAPSQAMAAFRHRFYDHRIICHNNKKLRTFERKAYYGGRLECFFIGERNEKVYELDVTSLYPSVMAGNLYPTKITHWQTPETHTTVRQPDIGLDTTATVLLRTQEGYPKRNPEIGTIYPIGSYITTLAGPELLRARDSGAIQRVIAWCRCDMATIFDSFVSYFWDYRNAQTQAGKHLEANLAKLLMNGLYGKFGQMTNGWSDAPGVIPATSEFLWIESDGTEETPELYRRIGKCVQKWTGKQEHPYAFPLIAAYVTSYAREYVRSLRQVAGIDNTYYLVTDALFCNARGYSNLSDSNLIAENELGMLRVKHEAEYAKFEALHHYQIGDHKVEGSKKKAARPQEDGSFMELQFESLEKALKRKPDGAVHIKPIVKRYKKEYNRGIVGPDGWVKPLTLNEE